MKIIKKIFIGLVVIVLLLVVVSFFLSGKFHLDKTTTINAPASTVFHYVNNFKNWPKWSPWERKDSTIKNTFEGPTHGVGAKMKWTSKESGNGNMTIDSSIAGKFIAETLVFEDFNTTSHVTFKLEEKDGKTTITWAIDGNLGKAPWSKYFALMMPGMMTEDFESGLKYLKEECEKETFMKVDERNVEPFFYLGVKKTVSMDELGPAMGEWFTKIYAYGLKNNGGTPGATFAIYHSWGTPKFDVEMGVPFSNKELKGKDEIVASTSYGGKVLSTIYTGPYSSLEKPHTAVQKWMELAGYEKNGPPWEAYINDPGSVKDSDDVPDGDILPDQIVGRMGLSSFKMTALQLIICAPFDERGVYVTAEGCHLEHSERPILPTKK